MYICCYEQQNKEPSMIEFKSTKLLPLNIKALFEIVADVDSYPQFVPWCLEAKVLERQETFMKAQLNVGTGMFTDTYISDVTLTPYSKIESTCNSGPLKSLKNTWNFEEAPEGTKVTLTCTFELSSFFLNTLMRGLIEDIGSKMIKAFEERTRNFHNS